MNDPVDKFFESPRVGPPYFESTPNITPEAEAYYKQLFDEMAQEIEEETRLKDEDEEDTPDILEVVKLAKEKLKEKKDE